MKGMYEWTNGEPKVRSEVTREWIELELFAFCYSPYLDRVCLSRGSDKNLNDEWTNGRPKGGSEGVWEWVCEYGRDRINGLFFEYLD